ncbi:MAG TPA: hypothetical protein VH257_08265 [Chloroflexota bacterium]|nr:hypothetical protein [Chloroflexota bacterium]
MSTVNELAQGLARRCETVHGLRCYPEMAAKPEPPAVCIGGPIRWVYDESFDATWRPVFEVWVFVAAADPRSSQQALFSYLAPTGSRSIPAALYGDTTLGGVAEEVKVLGGVRPPAVTDTAGGQLLGCALEVEVTAV